MAQLVSDYVLARLRDWGVEHVFAFPGDGINGLLAAWGRAGNKPQFVQSRHEEMSAFEAVGYAKFTGRVGVCAATSGPGAVHLLNGLYDAKLHALSAGLHSPYGQPGPVLDRIDQRLGHDVVHRQVVGRQDTARQRTWPVLHMQ